MSTTAFWLMWVGSGLVSTGLAFAYFQSEYPLLAAKERRQNYGFSVAVGLVGGPVGLLVIFCLSGFAKHGWRLR